MKISFISLFPESIRSVLETSIIGRAIRHNIITIQEIQIRNFAQNKQKIVDDSPYGGGPGQLLKINVLVSALRSTLDNSLRTRIILTDAAAKKFKQIDAKRLSTYKHLIFICGRYEGIDARIEHYVDEAFSIGDYVLTGGELASLVMLDAIARYVPGVVGNPESLSMESHATEEMVEHRQYTRPFEFEGRKVPNVLISGNHKDVQLARLLDQINRTKYRN